MAAQDFFACVEGIRNADKYFDVSRGGVLRALLAGGRCELQTDHDLFLPDGSQHSVSLRLNIKTFSDLPASWTVSLKMHGIRIDCIDHEEKYRTFTGEIGHGWHRHLWDASQENAERQKVPVDGLAGVKRHEDFLIRAFKVLRVTLNATDYGLDELLLA